MGWEVREMQAAAGKGGSAYRALSNWVSSAIADKADSSGWKDRGRCRAVAIGNTLIKLQTEVPKSRLERCSHGSGLCWLRSVSSAISTRQITVQHRAGTIQNNYSLLVERRAYGKRQRALDESIIPRISYKHSS
jgi:hypothetical protein